MEKTLRDEDVELDCKEERMIRSPSSDGKMVIKLKIPKLAAVMEVEKSSSSDVIESFSTSSLKTAKEGESMNRGTRVCPECKKEFSSGKALGGHMRVHVQAANKNSTFPKHSKTTTKFNKVAHHDFNNGDENRKLIDMKKEEQQQRKPYYASCVNHDGKPTCSLCGKIFPSMKSLFGHMRCHPERLWRGILPPPNTPTTAAPRRTLLRNKPNCFASSTSSFSSLSENVNEEGSNIVVESGDQVVDLTKFLRGWSVTERRGRRVLQAAEDDEVLLGAVDDLMILAHADPSTVESDVTQRQLGAAVLERSNSNSLTNKDHKTEDKSPSITGKAKATMEEEIEPLAKMEFHGGGMIKSFSDNESDSRNNEQLLNSYKYKNPLISSPYKSPTKIKKRKKMKLMMDLEQFTVVAGDPVTPPPPLLLPMPLQVLEQHAINESKYKCISCNKCFATHQALGGHRSSHNKAKITSTDHHQTEADGYDKISFLLNQPGESMEREVEFVADAMVALGSNNNSNNGIHQCKICDKVFPTGQALGGHKRCHWGTTGTIEAQAPSSQFTSTGEAASQTGSGRRKGLDIDLNEFPPTTTEDEAGNGYASSSYNSNMG